MSSVVSTEQFLEYNQAPEIQDDFGNNSVNRCVFNMYMANPEYQKEAVLVNFPSDIREDHVQRFKVFGIYRPTDRLDLGNRKYVVLIDGSMEDLEENLLEYVENYVNKYFPVDCNPKYYMIYDVFLSEDLHARLYGMLVQIYPDIEPLYEVETFTRKKMAYKEYTEFVREVEEYDLINITDIVREIDSVMKEDHFNDLLRLIAEKEKELLALAANVSNPLFFVHKDIFEMNVTIEPVLAAYMFLRHGLRTHLPAEARMLYNRYISDMSFSLVGMSATEQIDYIKYLPNMALYHTAETDLRYVVVLDLSSMKASVPVQFVDFEAVRNFIELYPRWTEEDLRSHEDILKVTENLLEVKDIVTARIFDYYPLNRASLRDSCDQLLKVFNLLEDLMPKNENIFDVTNVFLMDTLDGLKIAVRSLYKVTIPALVFPLDEELSEFPLTITESNLSGLKRIYMYPGYEKEIANVCQKIAVNHISLGGDLPHRYKTDFYREDRAIGLFFRFYSHFEGKRLKTVDYDDYVTLGLFWGETYSYRSGLRNDLERHINFKKMRKENGFMSIFGGPFEPMYLRMEKVQGITENYVRGG